MGEEGCEGLWRFTTSTGPERFSLSKSLCCCSSKKKQLQNVAGESVAAHQTLSGEDTHWFFLHPADRAGVASMRWERTERFVFPLQQQIKQDCGWSFCSAWPECDSLSCGTSPPIYEYGNVSHFNGPHRLHYFVPFWLMTNQSSLQRSPHTHFILGFRPVVVMLPLFSGDREGESTKFSYTSLSMTHVSDMLYNERMSAHQLTGALEEGATWIQ